MAWQVTISGVAVGAEINYIQETLNGHEEAAFKIPNNPEMRYLVGSDNDAVFSFGGGDIFRGYVVRPEYDQESINCIAYNEVYTRLDRKVFSANYTKGTNSQYVFQQIVSGVANVATGTCPASTVAIRYDYTSSFDAIKALAQALNSDYWTTAGSTVHIGTRGSDKGTIPAIAISRRTDDRSKKRDKVYVRGFDKSGTVIVGSAGNGTDEVSFIERKAADQATLNKVASYKLAQLNKDTQGVKVTLSIADASDINPGDSVTIEAPELKLSGSYKVWKTIKKPTTVDIEIDRPDAMLEEFIESVRDFGDVSVYTLGGSLLSKLPYSGTINYALKILPSDIINAQLVIGQGSATPGMWMPSLYATPINPSSYLLISSTVDSGEDTGGVAALRLMARIGNSATVTRPVLDVYNWGTKLMTITAGGDVLPGGIAQKLGSTTEEWLDGWFSGNIYVGQYMYHHDDVDTYISFTNNAIQISAGGTDFLSMSTSTNIIIINDGGLDRDFIVEGVGVAQALFVQGSDGFVGVNDGSPTYQLDVNGTFRTTGAAIAPSLLSTAAYSGTANYGFEIDPSDITGALLFIGQGTSTAGDWMPMFGGTSIDSAAYTLFTGQVYTGEDSGTVAAVRIMGRIGNAALTTRPVLDVYNYGTKLFTIAAAGVATFTGNVNPNADGTLNLGTQTTAQWANLWSDLVNGAEISMENGWRMLESELYEGYPEGWAVGHSLKWKTGVSIWHAADKFKYTAGEVPVFAVTDEFLEHMGFRWSPSDYEKRIAKLENLLKDNISKGKVKKLIDELVEERLNKKLIELGLI